MEYIDQERTQMIEKLVLYLVSDPLYSLSKANEINRSTNISDPLLLPKSALEAIYDNQESQTLASIISNRPDTKSLNLAPNEVYLVIKQGKVRDQCVNNLYNTLREKLRENLENILGKKIEESSLEEEIKMMEEKWQKSNQKHK